MFGFDVFDWLFVIWAFVFQIMLILHFGIRKLRFELIHPYGWLTYTLAIPAVIVSLILFVAGKDWTLWIGGLLCAIWAWFGFSVEYVRHIKWRNPIVKSIFFPFITLYLATIMFYWFPVGALSRPLWYGYAILFIISTVLNVLSHQPDTRKRQQHRAT
jgi:hypothetical protein